MTVTEGRRASEVTAVAIDQLGLYVRWTPYASSVHAEGPAPPLPPPLVAPGVTYTWYGMPALLNAPIFLRQSLVAVSLGPMMCVPHLIACSVAFRSGSGMIMMSVFLCFGRLE